MCTPNTANKHAFSRLERDVPDLIQKKKTNSEIVYGYEKVRATFPPNVLQFVFEIFVIFFVGFRGR